MRRIITLVVLIVIIISFSFVSYRYLIIRNGMSVYFMEKSPHTFEQVYMDVTKWTFRDYALHPKISTFLAAKGVQRTGRNLEKKLKKGMESAKDEVKSLKEKLSQE